MRATPVARDPPYPLFSIELVQRGILQEDHAAITDHTACDIVPQGLPV